MASPSDTTNESGLNGVTDQVILTSPYVPIPRVSAITYNQSQIATHHLSLLELLPRVSAITYNQSQIATHHLSLLELLMTAMKKSAEIFWSHMLILSVPMHPE